MNVGEWAKLNTKADFLKHFSWLFAATCIWIMLIHFWMITMWMDFGVSIKYPWLEKEREREFIVCVCVLTFYSIYVRIQNEPKELVWCLPTKHPSACSSIACIILLLYTLFVWNSIALFVTRSLSYFPVDGAPTALICARSHPIPFHTRARMYSEK